jgi:hypothetical protein
VDATAQLVRTGRVVTIEFPDYVEALLRSLYPHADVIVTPEPDRVSFEVYEASFSLHASIGDERSAVLAALEQLLLKACLAES